MVSVLRLVNGKVYTQQPVSDGTITSDALRHTDGLWRGQVAIRSMENVLSSIADVTKVSYLSDSYDTRLEVFNDGSKVCEYVIAMRRGLDSPWYPRGEKTWDFDHPISV